MITHKQEKKLLDMLFEAGIIGASNRAPIAYYVKSLFKDGEKFQKAIDEFAAANKELANVRLTDTNARIAAVKRYGIASEGIVALATKPLEHVCGESGYNGMIDDPCPACEANWGGK